jgi:GTP-binding protein
VTNYRTIRDELENYSTELAGKDELVVLNKIDLLPVDERDEAISTIVDELGLKEVVFTSSATREGISDLLERSWILTKK